jgi:hypothetical protein
MDKEFVQARPGVARLMPLYGGIIIAFLGYSMMVTLFVPMLMHKSAGFLPENFTTAQRTTLLGLLLGGIGNVFMLVTMPLAWANVIV